MIPPYVSQVKKYLVVGYFFLCAGEFYLLSINERLWNTSVARSFQSLGKSVNDSIRVLIVIDDDVLCQRMRRALENAAGVISVGQARDGEKAIDLMREMRRETRPDVVLLDTDAPRASNLQTVGQMRELFPYTKIIVLNDAGQEELVLQALREGALGHLVKDKARPSEIVQAIRAVSRGEAIFSPGIAGWMLDEVTRKHKKRQNEA